ncbi:hypothetical protein ABZ464_03085 [Streptomyces sp. NPDC005820]|uniref:hypothetical protein n=1 Tax=Streptomyces sp. NPDC005820 TaxID=3157069 RepID=UPI00340DFC3F
MAEGVAGDVPVRPSAALVVGDTLVRLADEARGAKRAKYTSAEQFVGFRQLLVAGWA